MKKIVQQILIGATAVALTACGGDGGGTTENNGTTTGGGGEAGNEITNIDKIRLSKMTRIYEDYNYTTSYEYDEKGRLSESTYLDSEKGIIRSRTLTKYTYEDNRSKVHSDSYDDKGSLLYTLDMNDEETDEKVIKSTISEEFFEHPESSSTLITTYSSYEGPVAKKIIQKRYNSGGDLVYVLTEINKVSESKRINSIDTVKDADGKLLSESNITFDYDTKYRPYYQRTITKDANGKIVSDERYTKTYDNKNRVQPRFPCFSSRTEMKKLYNKYPKAARGCYLQTNLTMKTLNGEQDTEYLYEFNDKDLVTKETTKVNSSLQFGYVTYEYKGID